MQGSCLCGDVRYELAGPVESLGHCHCGMCRKAHGAAFATYAQVASDAFRVTRGAEGIRRYRSSAAVERSFCGRCGSNLTFAWDGAPQRLWVAAGSLDGDPGVRPHQHIFVASKAPWFEITDDLPRHAAYPGGAQDA